MAIKIALMPFNGSIFKQRKSFYESIHTRFASHPANVFTYFPIQSTSKKDQEDFRLSYVMMKPFKSFLMVLMVRSCYRSHSSSRSS